MATNTRPTIDTSQGESQLASIPRRLALIDWQPYALIAFLQVIMALAFLANSGSGASSWFDKFPLDDGWTHMVYARNFAEHAQF